MTREQIEGATVSALGIKYFPHVMRLREHRGEGWVPFVPVKYAILLLRFPGILFSLSSKTEETLAVMTFQCLERVARLGKKFFNRKKYIYCMYWRTSFIFQNSSGVGREHKVVKELCRNGGIKKKKIFLWCNVRRKKKGMEEEKWNGGMAREEREMVAAALAKMQAYRMGPLRASQRMTVHEELKLNYGGHGGW